MQVTAHHTLAGALGLKRRESVALVGGGGKTGALQRLAIDLAADGRTVIVTTTTAMFLAELEAAGPTVLDAVDDTLVTKLAACVEEHRVAGAARWRGDNGKVVGLHPATVDRLWAQGVADCLVVEADGSRGRSLKAFGRNEPQVPRATTVIAQVAGLDAIGKPLADVNVHRAGLLARALGVSPGALVSERVFVDALRWQLRRLHRGWRNARVVTLLNKADGPREQALGQRVARELLASGAAPADHSYSAADDERPDRVVVSSLREGRLTAVAAAEG